MKHVCLKCRKEHADNYMIRKKRGRNGVEYVCCSCSGEIWMRGLCLAYRDGVNADLKAKRNYRANSTRMKTGRGLDNWLKSIGVA